jgi:hypothetical protein
MGPKVRAFLGLEGAEYQGDVDERRSEQEVAAFTEHLEAESARLTDPEAFADLLDELVSMDLPEAVLRLAAARPELVEPADFRTQLAVGVAAMLRGDLPEAEDRLRAAQGALPEEPAPYVNLAQIFLNQGRRDEAELWALSGLDAEANNYRLWELVAVIYRDRFGEYAPDRLLQLAEKRASWAGLALAASMTTTGDRYFKLNLLERLYHQGEREPQFLVELTAAMGVAGFFERIPAVVWQAERLAQKALPWQLHVHCAQAQLATGKPDECRRELEKARRDTQLPAEAKAALEELEAEAIEAAQHDGRTTLH